MPVWILTTGCITGLRGFTFAYWCNFC